MASGGRSSCSCKFNEYCANLFHQRRRQCNSTISPRLPSANQAQRQNGARRHHSHNDRNFKIHKTCNSYTCIYDACVCVRKHTGITVSRVFRVIPPAQQQHENGKGNDNKNVVGVALGREQQQQQQKQKAMTRTLTARQESTQVVEREIERESSRERHTLRTTTTYD